MTRIDNVLYRAHAKATGGRDGRAVVPESNLDLKLTTPKQLGGAGGEGTNPEQLFAAGWSASFEDALALAAGETGITLPVGMSIDAEVDLNLGDGGYFLRVRLSVALPGLEQGPARVLVEAARQICPYSKATRGNIEVSIAVV